MFSLVFSFFLHHFLVLPLRDVSYFLIHVPPRFSHLILMQKNWSSSALSFHVMSLSSWCSPFPLLFTSSSSCLVPWFIFDRPFFVCPSASFLTRFPSFAFVWLLFFLTTASHCSLHHHTAGLQNRSYSPCLFFYHSPNPSKNSSCVAVSNSSSSSSVHCDSSKQSLVLLSCGASRDSWIPQLLASATAL